VSRFTTFVEATIDKVLANEKGYVNDPDDNGGETNYGITVRVARANGYTGEMLFLPISLARAIYKKRYIEEPAFDKVAELSERIAEELIDTGVNMGPSRAAEMLQRWLNGFNDRATRYEDLFVDGRIGEITLEALHDYLVQRGEEGEKVLYMALNCTQGTRYLELAEATPRQERFLYGWMRTRVANILES
jgi:lysozyme family protein